MPNLQDVDFGLCLRKDSTSGSRVVLVPSVRNLDDMMRIYRHENDLKMPNAHGLSRGSDKRKTITFMIYGTQIITSYHSFTPIFYLTTESQLQR